MPELPEVESIRLGLVDLIGNEINQVRAYKTDSLLDPNSLDLSLLKKQTLREILRHGKYLQFILDDYKFLLHLGMSGVLRVNGEIEKHSHLILDFKSGGQLIYTDPRRFGYWNLMPMEHKFPRWENLGPDVLARNFSGKYLYGKSRRSAVHIKGWILNQRNVAGVGNIYASEALFAASINPLRPANSLSEAESRALVKELRRIMRKSIENRGTTFSDYRLSDGKSGDFQNFLQVFQKEDLPCPKCENIITKINQNGRSTFYCAQCQKE